MLSSNRNPFCTNHRIQYTDTESATDPIASSSRSRFVERDHHISIPVPRSQSTSTHHQLQSRHLATTTYWEPDQSLINNGVVHFSDNLRWNSLPDLNTGGAYLKVDPTERNLANIEPIESSPTHGKPMCDICRTEYESGETLSHLPCKHAFHATCINNWLKQSYTCPRCRASVLQRAQPKNYRPKPTRSEAIQPSRPDTFNYRYIVQAANNNNNTNIQHTYCDNRSSRMRMAACQERMRQLRQSTPYRCGGGGGYYRESSERDETSVLLFNVYKNTASPAASLDSRTETPSTPEVLSSCSSPSTESSQAEPQPVSNNYRRDCHRPMCSTAKNNLARLMAGIAAVNRFENRRVDEVDGESTTDQTTDNNRRR